MLRHSCGRVYSLMRQPRSHRLALLGNQAFGKNLSATRSFSDVANKVNLPDEANVVIIGGGIIGNSIAYHLAKQGVSNVCLLEQSQLTAGTTWHAAGLMVTFGSLSETSTEIRKYTKSLYASLEAETGHSTGFKPCGFIELATEPDKLEEYRRIAAFNRLCGVDVEEISPAEVKRLFPLCKVDDVYSGFYVKTDGRVNPVDACVALSKGAKMYGASLFEGVTVEGVESVPDASRMNRIVTGVRTSSGHFIKAKHVVNCSGMWARQLGEIDGVNIPNQAAEHYYLITDSIPGIDPNWPVVEDPASYTYIRPEGAGLMVGLFEGKAKAWNVGSIPKDFSFGEIEPDWERMTKYVEKAMNRVPATLTAGVKKFFCGPESFTPDLAPIIGESPEIRNYFVAAGLNSIGILSGGGIGRLVANWIITGKPDMDVTGFNIDRLHKYQSNPQYREERVVETLGLVYKTHYPYKSKLTARGAKRSPFYQQQLEAGAYFKDVSGWEGADWFAPSKELAKIEQHTWDRQHWFPYWANEHKACREGVVLIDMSFMSKFLVQGRDAGEALNRLCTANIDGPKDMITYTQMLNEDGKMEADITVSKLDDDKFLVIATDTMHRHVETLCKRHLDPEGKKHVMISDVTGGYSQLNIQGPNSRKVMEELVSSCDMSDVAFPFRTAKEVAIGYARVLCARITYVGELGYELHIPTEFAQHVHERVLAVGAKYGLVNAGLKALASLRMEKAYRDYGHDMDNTDTFLEVGLGFTADYKKKGGFIGMEKVMEQRQQLKELGGLNQRLVQVLCKDPQPLMYHGEVIWRDDVPVGYIRIASYGHTLGGAVGLAMVRAPTKDPSSKAIPVVNKAFLSEGKWEVEINGKRYPCVASLNPLYDPNNKKIKM